VTNTVSVPTSTIDAVEEGPNVAVGLTVPVGATQIYIVGVPLMGQLLLADGTPVQPGAALTQTQLTGMVYVPPADYLPGTAVGDLRYGATVGATQVVGTVGVNITAVNDAPVAAAGSASGFEDTTIPVSLHGSDVDSPIGGITIQQLPTTGALLLADGVTAVAAGQWLTPAQAAGLLYRPDPNASGSTSVMFTATDDQGATSAPATWTLTVNAVDDLPVVGGDSFTVAEDGSSTINVLTNDADPEGNPLTVTQVNGTPIVDGGPAVAVLHGNVQLVGGQLVFTPAPNYNGPVNFTYTASVVALLAWFGWRTFGGSNYDRAYGVAVTPDGTKVYVTGRVTSTNAGFDGVAGSITQVNGAAIVDGGAAVAVPGGNVQLAAGQLVFTPAPNTNGPVGFSYTVSNGSVASTGTVSGVVTPVLDVSTVTCLARSRARKTPRWCSPAAMATH
jgi:hypothetical protein